MIEERAKGVSAAGAVVSDATLSPAAVVNGVIGLHGRDHVQLREAVEVFGGHMLRVLDAPATITAAMGLFDLGINVEDRRNSSVSDGVGADLHSRGIRPHHAIPHQRDWMHLIREQAAVVRLIREGFKEIRRGRAERAIGIGLHPSDSQIWAAKRPPDADLHLVVHLRDQRCSIDARGQVAFVKQL